MTMKKIRDLIPSIGVEQSERVEEFSKFFDEVELDMFGANDVRKDFHTFMELSESFGTSIYSVHLRGLTLGSSDKSETSDIINICRDICEMSDPLFPSMFVIHPNRKNMEDLISEAEFLARRISQESKIAVENMTSDNYILSSPSSVYEFVKGIEHPNVGVCVDVSHPKAEQNLNRGDYTSLVLDYLEAADEQLFHLHFSDRGDDKHLPIGDGVLDWQRIRKFLSDQNLQVRSALEIRSDDPEDVLNSASTYLDMEDLYISDTQSIVMEDDYAVVHKREALNVLVEEWNFPKNMIKLLNMPSELYMDEGEDYKYFFTRSESYTSQHEDPYLSLSGNDSDTGWTDYLFGMKVDCGRLYTVLIDQNRNVSMSVNIASLYSDNSSYNWTSFKNALEISLQQINDEQNIDHVKYTYDQPEIIYKGDPSSWQ